MTSHQQLIEKASRQAKSLQLDQIHTIATAWRKFDVNGDETVTIGEVDQVLNHMNVKISDDKKKQLQNDLDRNGDGTISFLEFVKFYENGKYKEYL